MQLEICRGKVRWNSDSSPLDPQPMLFLLRFPLKGAGEHGEDPSDSLPCSPTWASSRWTPKEVEIASMDKSPMDKKLWAASHSFPCPLFLLLFPPLLHCLSPPEWPACAKGTSLTTPLLATGSGLPATLCLLTGIFNKLRDGQRPWLTKRRVRVPGREGV